MPLTGPISLGPIFGLTAVQSDYALELVYHGVRGAWMKHDQPMTALMNALLDDRGSLSDAQLFAVLHTVLAKAADDWEAPILTAQPVEFAQAAFAMLQFGAETGPLQWIDHVQVAIPKGGEATAIPFYRDLLGLTETPKPTAMAGRGGAWYQSGHIKVHLGVEEPFRANDKAHVAFVVDDVAELAAKAAKMGFAVNHDFDLPDYRRAFIYDPFGNRIEVLRTNSLCALPG